MKRIIYFALLIIISGVYMGCSENEIELYNQTPRINFYGNTHLRILIDTDYVKKEPYSVDSFTVQIQGDLLKESRDFCVKVTPNSNYKNSVDVLLNDKYTYTSLDTIHQVFYFRFTRPEMKKGKNLYGCNLEFDLDNSAHKFDKGLVEKNQIIFSVRWEIEPDEWDWEWGDYSDAKYMFMMDILGHTSEDVEDIDADKAKVVDAYANYKAEGNPPILDEDGNEISFE